MSAVADRAAAAPKNVTGAVPAADDYVAFCEGLRQICGVDLSQYRRPQMERRLRAFFARKGVEILTDSLALLRHDRAALDALLDRMTINVSQLWRHREQWERLEHDVLPVLVRGGQLRAWSAGCSYGAEAFTLAAVCHRAIPTARVRIVGTDIDRRMIERARTGLFSDSDARGIAAAELDAGFERLPDGWCARDVLRRMTSFEHGDLLRMQPPAGVHDLILCRNTVIYFAEPIRDELHAHLARALRSGGYLVVGATERVSDPADLQLEMAFPFIYRKA
ncbi:MAG: CheR family methyltransferase [Solirubrobacteraceae bacterium]